MWLGAGQVELTFPWEDAAPNSTDWLWILLPCCSFLLLFSFFFWQLHIPMWFLHIKLCLVMLLCGVPVKAAWTAGSLRPRAALKSSTNWTFGLHVRVCDQTGEGGTRSKQWPVAGGSVFMITLICRMAWGRSSPRDYVVRRPLKLLCQVCKTQVRVQLMVLKSIWTSQLGFPSCEVDKAALWSSRTPQSTIVAFVLRTHYWTFAGIRLKKSQPFFFVKVWIKAFVFSILLLIR